MEILNFIEHRAEVALPTSIRLDLSEQEFAQSKSFGLGIETDREQ